MKIVMLGAGNVATQLALALTKAGHQVVQVYNRSRTAGEGLAHKISAPYTADLAALADADLYLVSVKDDAIAQIASQLKLADKFVVHTSGTKSSTLLKDVSPNYGVFYPLQTITKNATVDFSQIPFLLEGSNNDTLMELEALAAALSKRIYVVDEQQRQWIHLAAVFANNFTNHMYTISERLLLDHGLPFDILKPLIFKAIENLETFSPSQIQTGPAVRGDYQVIDKHLQLLADEQRLKKVYEVLTDSIIASIQNSPVKPII